MRTSCIISGRNCLSPAGYGGPYGWMVNTAQIDLSPCFACGEPVCDHCSGAYWHMGAVRRLCIHCASEHGALPFTAITNCELCSSMPGQGEELRPYGGKQLCPACRQKLDAVRVLVNQPPEWIVAWVFAP